MEGLNLARLSEIYRKEFSSKLQIEKVKNEVSFHYHIIICFPFVEIRELDY